MNNNSKENKIALPSTLIKNICKINHIDNTCVSCHSGELSVNVKDSKEEKK